MILKVSEKTNANGWRRQLIVDHTNKTYRTGSFLFHYGDLEGLTHKQYLALIECYKSAGFTELR